MAKKKVFQLGKDGASLGAKATGLNAMASLGLSVPAGFAIATATEPTASQLHAAVKKIGQGFGSASNPLFLAVRPSVNGHVRGYMEAILNVGLNDETVEGLARRLDDGPLAYDLYRQFIENYAVNVLGLRHADFEDILAEHNGPDLISKYKSFIESKSGESLPQDVNRQLLGVLKAARHRECSLALVVQEMVYGGSIHGVATSRNFFYR